jgi:hypothetical protein
MYSPSSQCVSFLTPQASNLFLGIGIICMLGGGGVWDFIWVLVVPIVFSLCSQKVPNYAPSVFPKFPMCSQQVPNAFPTGSQCGPPSPPPKKIKPKFSTTLRGGHHPRKFEACGADFGYSFWRDSWGGWYEPFNFKCKLMHSKCGMCKLFFVLVLFFFFFFFHKCHRKWWSGRTIYTVEPEQTWAAGPVASLAWRSEVSDWWDWHRKTISLPNLFVSCFSARPFTQATIANSLQWGVVMLLFQPFIRFLCFFWRNEKGDETKLWCPDRQLFLPSLYHVFGLCL